MQFYPIYHQKNEREILDLITTSSTCMLLTQGPGGKIQTGIFNPLYRHERFYLHLHRQDEQAQSLYAHSQATIVFHDILGIIPSYWVDADYAGAATTYYRYAEFDCTSTIHTQPEYLADIMSHFMCQYQPEGGHSPLKASSPIYQRSLEEILLVELCPSQIRTKWKIGQNRSEKIRRDVAQRFRALNSEHGNRAAREIEKSLTH